MAPAAPRSVMESASSEVTTPGETVVTRIEGSHSWRRPSVIAQAAYIVPEYTAPVGTTRRAPMLTTVRSAGTRVLGWLEGMSTRFTERHVSREGAGLLVVPHPGTAVVSRIRCWFGFVCSWCLPLCLVGLVWFGG